MRVRATEVSRWRTIACGCVALGLSACTTDASVGTSAIPQGVDEPPSARGASPGAAPVATPEASPASAPKPALPPKSATNFVPEPNRRVFGSRVLGDLDGDGYDDFVVVGEQGYNGGSLDGSLETAEHLFYGKPSFPMQLSTADAHATFTGGALQRIGDVNGDGFDDLSYQNSSGTRLVFGGVERIASPADLDRADTVTWEGETDPLRTYEAWPLRAGDVNNDGFDDLIVTVMASAYHETTDTHEMSVVTYLLWGRTSWPTGRFDPAWAAAVLDSGGPLGFDFYPVLPADQSDIDSDGFDDLIAFSRRNANLVAFYGRPDRFSDRSGELVPDVEWIARSNRPYLPVGDLDGDGFLDLVSFSLPLPADQPGALNFHYGGPGRWSGRIDLVPDFQLESTSYFDQTVGLGDIDGDTFPDLIVHAPLYGAPQLEGALFALRGTGERLTGRGVLEPDQMLMPAPPNLGGTSRLGDIPPLSGEIDVSGDIDGDGSRDVLIGAPGLPASTASGGEGGAFLIPSTPSAPK